MEAAETEDAVEVSCVLIPTEDTPLLLPNVCVAEILPWRRVVTIDGMPDWCLGMLDWRGESIPVVRFERINKSTVQGPKVGRCMVVMHRTQSADGVPFYAIATEGLPRILQLTDADIANVPTQLGAAEASAITVGMERVVIPDLRYIEDLVAESVRGRSMRQPTESANR